MLPTVSTSHPSPLAREDSSKLSSPDRDGPRRTHGVLLMQSHESTGAVSARLSDSAKDELRTRSSSSSSSTSTLRDECGGDDGVVESALALGLPRVRNGISSDDDPVVELRPETDGMEVRVSLDRKVMPCMQLKCRSEEQRGRVCARLTRLLWGPPRAVGARRGIVRNTGEATAVKREIGRGPVSLSQALSVWAPNSLGGWKLCTRSMWPSMRSRDIQVSSWTSRKSGDTS
ncbi:unnamed protein product [Phytophthora fragariaefolia]|uniref:Unnamed protein product n=1 Tax=Phytophthora fragariaefolia TaxID=1490495 RepID=A0A9W6WXD0_9STRA|nr:unnamed protein product [Phytophthora fragariaefolia]